MPNQPYYILTGIIKETNEREMIFGDFNKQVVVEERRDTSRNEYKFLKVRKVKDSTQASIDRLLLALPIHTHYKHING